MAIVNSVATYQPDSAQLIQNIGVTMLTAAPQNVPVPATGSISPAVVRGKGRAKIYNQTVAITVTNIVLTALDGTNTATIDAWNPPAGLAITATAYLDVMFQFILDTSTAGGGATGTLIFGGATSFNYAVTMTGAGGTAKGDFEIAAQP